VPALLLESPATHVDWAPDGRQIVFTVETSDGKSEIWVADSDGTHRRLLFDCAAGCSLADDPAWSPDGGQIAFWWSDESAPRQSVRIVDADTGAVDRDIEFGKGIAPVYPDWSPDGDRLVAAACPDACSDVRSPGMATRQRSDRGLGLLSIPVRTGCVARRAASPSAMGGTRWGHGHDRR